MPTLNEIQQFFSTNPSPQQIAAAMAAHPEVTSSQIAQAQGELAKFQTQQTPAAAPATQAVPPWIQQSQEFMASRGLTDAGDGTFRDAEGRTRTAGYVNQQMEAAGIQSTPPDVRGSNGVSYKGTTVNGQPYAFLAQFANDPAAMQQERANLQQQGIQVIDDPNFGPMALANDAFTQSHPVQNNSSIFDMGPVAMMGFFGAAAAAGGLAAGAGASAGTGAGSAAVGGASAADILGLQQMGQAAGLSGESLTAFVNSGGALGSTVAGGGGIGTGVADQAWGVNQRFTGANEADLGMDLGNLDPTTGLPTNQTAFTGANEADLGMELGNLDPTTGLPTDGINPYRPPTPTPNPTNVGGGNQPFDDNIDNGPITGDPNNPTGTNVTPGVLPDWLKSLLPAGTTLGSLLGNLGAGALGAYASGQQSDALTNMSREQGAREDARYNDLVRREQERFGILTGREDTALALQNQIRGQAGAIGSPFRDRLSGLYLDPSSFLSSPEVQVPVQQGTDIMARSLSARGGNPIGSGGALQQLQSYASDQLFGKLGQEKDRLGTLGGMASFGQSGAWIPGTQSGLPTQASAGSNIGTNAGNGADLASIQAQGNIYGQLGQMTSNIFNPVQQGMTLADLQRLMGGR